MKTQLPKPWLTSGGLEVPTEQLKTISQTWDPATWSRYLNWYESRRRESLIDVSLYSDKCDQAQQNIFSELGYETSEETAQLCETLLGRLTGRERNVLSAIFLDGMTERNIASSQGLSPAGVHKIKFRGLMRLKRELHGDKVSTRRFMRGEEISTAAPLVNYAKEEKVYDPKNHKAELAEIQHHELCQAVSNLSERQQRIIYLRFWCDYSFKQIALELGIGVNSAEQICEAAVSRLKRSIAETASNSEVDGGPSCA